MRCEVTTWNRRGKCAIVTRCEGRGCSFIVDADQFPSGGIPCEGIIIEAEPPALENVFDDIGDNKEANDG
jgi:hypothetical protein